MVDETGGTGELIAVLVEGLPYVLVAVVAVCALEYIFIPDVRNRVNTTISGIINSAEELIRKITASFARAAEGVQNKYRSSYEWHHIVAQSSPQAAEARVILEYLGIDINSADNMVYIKTGLHRRLHYLEYYMIVNDAIISAFLLGESYADKQANVLAVLKELQIWLTLLSENSPF